MTPLVRDYPDATALIAGGTSGIGLASARSLAEAGVRRIVLLGRDTARGEEACRSVTAVQPDADVRFVATDAAEPAQVLQAVRFATQEFGSLDIVVCSTAPSHRPELLLRTSPEDLLRILADFTHPPLLLTRMAMDVMREQGGGSIVNVASDAGKTATPGESAIGAAMAAIVMFSRVAAIEGKRDGIRVNALTPSLVNGTATTETIMAGGFSQRLFEKAAEQAHLGVTTPQDIAALVAFLAGPAAAKLTGQAISVNGGISAA